MGEKWVIQSEVLLEQDRARRVGGVPLRLHCYLQWAPRRGARRKLRTRQPAALRNRKKGFTRALVWARDSKAARVATGRSTIGRLAAATIFRGISESPSGFRTISLAHPQQSRQRTG